MLAFVALAVIDAYVLFRATRVPANLVELKRRYATLREHLRRMNKFPSLWREKPVTGFYGGGRRGNVGYNSNKGDDISVCLDGDDINSIMHVFIHELAHCTVPEFSHSDQYWRNKRELTQIAVDLGVYEKVTVPKDFCGKEIGDGS